MTDSLPSTPSAGAAEVEILDLKQRLKLAEYGAETWKGLALEHEEERDGARELARDFARLLRTREAERDESRRNFARLTNEYQKLLGSYAELNEENRKLSLESLNRTFEAEKVAVTDDMAADRQRLVTELFQAKAERDEARAQVEQGKAILRRILDTTEGRTLSCSTVHELDLANDILKFLGLRAAGKEEA